MFTYDHLRSEYERVWHTGASTGVRDGRLYITRTKSFFPMLHNDTQQICQYTQEKFCRMKSILPLDITRVFRYTCETIWSLSSFQNSTNSCHAKAADGIADIVEYIWLLVQNIVSLYDPSVLGDWFKTNFNVLGYWLYSGFSHAKNLNILNKKNRLVLFVKMII